MRSFRCKECGETSKTYESKKMFCSHSCSAIYNNRNKPNKKKDLPCNYCGKPRNKHASKFCSRKCQSLMERDQKIKSGNYSTLVAKKYLLSINNKCLICKLEPIWNNKPLMMVLDHIDGNSENNDLSNLRLVCPNCDSQLDTFKSRNRGNGRYLRRTRYKNGQSY